MPKNNNQESALDKLAAEMEAQAQGTGTTQQATQEQAAQEQAGQEQAEAENKEPYVPAQNEKHLYHVELEKPFFNKRTGKRLSKPTVQKFTEMEYKSLMEKKNEKDKSIAEMLGYTVNVLWNPKEHI